MIDFSHIMNRHLHAIHIFKDCSIRYVHLDIYVDMYVNIWTNNEFSTTVDYAFSKTYLQRYIATPFPFRKLTRSSTI